MTRTVDCGPGHTDGRRRKMEAFVAAAQGLELFDAEDDPDVSDALVSLRVNAGIAAADVICCRRLGHHAAGSDHADAVALLSTVDTALGNHLRRLLQMKPKAHYSAFAVSNQELKTTHNAPRHRLAAGTGRSWAWWTPTARPSWRLGSRRPGPHCAAVTS